jgi:CheY-like chemotaxis protein
MLRSILLVDDDAAICETLTEILEDHGCAVTVVSDGRKALDYLRRDDQAPPGMILLDLMMPEMDGLEFLDEYGKDPKLSHVPVVVLSANPGLCGPKHRNDVLLYLNKPINVPNLLGAVDLWCAA